MHTQLHWRTGAMVERLTLLILSNLGCFEQLFVLSCSRLALIWSTISTMRASGCWENSAGFYPHVVVLQFFKRENIHTKVCSICFHCSPLYWYSHKKNKNKYILFSEWLFMGPQRICSNWAALFVPLPSVFSWTRTRYIIDARVSAESAVLGLPRPHTLPPLPPPLTHTLPPLLLRLITSIVGINNQCTSATWRSLYPAQMVRSLRSVWMVAGLSNWGWVGGASRGWGTPFSAQCTPIRPANTPHTQGDLLYGRMDHCPKNSTMNNFSQHLPVSWLWRSQDSHLGGVWQPHLCCVKQWTLLQPDHWSVWTIMLLSVSDDNCV